LIDSDRVEIHIYRFFDLFGMKTTLHQSDRWIFFIFDLEIG